MYRAVWIILLVLCLPAESARAGQATQAGSQTAAPLTLEAALALARANGQAYLSARTAAQLAAEDRTQARAALLPSLNGFAQFVGTETNGEGATTFVSSDGPRVYNVWGTVHGDVFAPGKWAGYRSAGATAAAAQAKADVAARGLVATVVQNYYGFAAAVRKAASARQNLTETEAFLDITQKQEQAGEVAHSDVIKAQIQVAQRQRDAQDADLNLLKARLALSVLLYPDFREDVTIVDDLESLAPVPLLAAVVSASAGYPDVRAAEATLRQESFGLSVARGDLLPSVSFDYFYGINANQFATYNPEGQRLLGSMFQVQMTVPIWNWGATQSKLRQAELRIRQAKNDLTLAERQLLASQQTFHAEATSAAAQVSSLKSSLDLATESLRLTTLRYQAGEVTVLEVVDAQTTLVQARNAYDDGLVRYRVAMAALQTLTGTL